jgi:hypothetical protein
MAAAATMKREKMMAGVLICFRFRIPKIVN